VAWQGLNKRGDDSLPGAVFAAVTHNAGVQEIELKFGIAPDRLAAVRRAVLRPGSPAVRLRAAYYDTPDGRLAAAGIALRLRHEGRAWVQTLKVGLDPMRRLEHNVPLVLPRGATAALDPARHDGTPAGDALHAACGKAGLAALQVRFATDVTRHVRVLRGRGAAAGTTVELALDEGTVSAGALTTEAGRQLSEPLCELEIELLQGTPAGLIAFAMGWAARLGLWLDVRPKSWRGEYLARGQRYAPALKAAPPALPPQPSVDQAMRAVLRSCLDQVLANASQIAAQPPGGSGAHHGPEHVHQLRVGLRRLRSALRVFKGSSPVEAAPVDASLGGLLAPLGWARDRDVHALETLPALQAAGAPPLALPAAPAPQPALEDALRDPALTQLWLALLAAVQPPVAEVAASAPWQGLVAQHLRRWHKRMRRTARGSAHLSDEQRHQLRKQAKRLRYVIEFSAPLWPAAKLARQLAALRALQESLGQWHDVCTALARFEAQVAQDPPAWFAVGWLRARREALLAQAAQDLERWAEAPVPWKKRDQRK
jgi:triphosphatase